jgi:uncharacterized integral membrane protein (TIGR00698 family)
MARGLGTSGAAGGPPRWRPPATLPGLALCLALALGAAWLREASGIAGLNPVVVALLAGIGLRAWLGPMPGLRPGLAVAVRTLLRGAVVLLGLQVTLGQVLALGPGALLLALLSVVATVPAALWLGARLSVEPRLAALLGAGTGICGASAVVAANQVVRAREADAAYALAVITLCGTAGLLLLPLLGAALGLDPVAQGLWAGAALHEVVQAVGAAAASGPAAAEAGTVMKLSRVMLLAPAVLALGWWMARGAAAEGGSAIPVPWFAFGFLGMSGLASAGAVPPLLAEGARLLVPLLLAASVAALGLSTDLRALGARGLAPLLLGVALSLALAVLTLCGVLLLRAG